MRTQPAIPSGEALPRKRAILFIVALGIVSLFGDMTYEGARSISGPFLGFLGVTATTVGIVAGLGELLGYGARLFSGYLADRTERYWAITVAGYFINLLSVPLLALAGTWPIAFVLLLAERTGRGIRSPPRDAMLSQAASRTGLGWGFGLHSALDQTGGLMGPLLMAGLLFVVSGYHIAFALLAIPAALSILTLIVARLQFPRPREFNIAPPALETSGLDPVFRVYLVAVALIAAGYADFSLIAYHFATAKIMPVAWIPVFYSIAMAVEGGAGLGLGALYDKIGVWTMILATIASAAAAPLVFLGGIPLAVVGMICWGIGTGAQESVMRATIARLAPEARRATAFGIFNAVYGVAWFLGSVALGVIYDFSITAVAALSLGLQASSLPVFFWLARQG